MTHCGVLYAGTASIEGARVGSGSAAQRIAADAGFITTQRGAAAGRRRLSASDVSAAASKFLSPDGTVFYPGGTSWCVPRGACTALHAVKAPFRGKKRLAALVEMSASRGGSSECLPTRERHTPRDTVPCRFNMMQLETFTEAQIVSMLKMHYSKGVRVRPCRALLCSVTKQTHGLAALTQAHVLGVSLQRLFGGVDGLHTPCCLPHFAV